MQNKVIVKVTEDKEQEKYIRKEIRDNDGYCPCKLVKNEDTKCPCKDFKNLVKNGVIGSCHCGLYEIYDKNE